MDTGNPSINGYSIEEIIGEGGMGRVYRALRLSDNRTVAIKVILPRTNDDIPPMLKMRFRREMEVSSRLNHPGVVRTLDGGVTEDDGTPYLVTELLEGVTLEEHPEFGNLSIELARRLVDGVSEAFDYYHEMGLVHRDIKPSNLFIEDDGRVVLLDFGLVFVDNRTRLTRTTESPGTLLTMAPEQLSHEDMGPYTDVFQFASTLYISLTDKMAYDPMDLLHHASGNKTLELPIPLAKLRPDLPSHWGMALQACLEPDHRNRISSGPEMKELFGSESSPRKDIVTTPKKSAPSCQGRRKSNVLLAKLLLSLVVLIVLLSLAIMNKNLSLQETKEPTSKNIEELKSELVRSNQPDDQKLVEFGKLLVANGPAKGKAFKAIALRNLAEADSNSDKKRRLVTYYRLIESNGLFVFEDHPKILSEAFRLAKMLEQENAFLKRIKARMSLEASDKNKESLSLWLARKLFYDYSQTTNDDSLIKRELHGSATLSPTVDERLKEICSLLHPIIEKAQLTQEKIPLFEKYAEVLNAMRTDEAKSLVIQIFPRVLAGYKLSPLKIQKTIQFIVSLGYLRPRILKDNSDKVMKAFLPFVEDTIKHAPNKSIKALWTVYLAGIHLQTGKLEHARTTLRESLLKELSKKEQWRYYWISGFIYEDINKLREARAEFKKGYPLAHNKEIRMFFYRRLVERNIENIFLGGDTLNLEGK